MISLVERARRSEVLGQLLRFGLVGGFVTALGAGALTCERETDSPPRTLDAVGGR